MAQEHDPIQQRSYLRQCLSQDKRPLGLFLGAGCPQAVRSSEEASSPPLIPGIGGITAEVRKRMKESGGDRLLERLIEALASDGKSEPDIEDYFNLVRGLRAVAGTECVRGFSSSDLDTLDEEISTAVAELVRRSLPDRRSPYHTVASWVGAASRVFPVEIFTTNYDLLIEQALELARVPFFDGFVGSHRPYFDTYAMDEDKLPARWARVWKLHGSINWRRESNGAVVRTEPAATMKGVVIHPSHLKYEQSRRMPYLAMLDRLRAFCKQRDAVLVTCGYSFRDDHINDLIAQGLEGNPTAVTFALMRSELDRYAKALPFASGRPNLSLLAKDGAVIGTRRAAWKTTVPHQDNNGGLRLGDFEEFGHLMEDILPRHDESIADSDAK